MGKTKLFDAWSWKRHMPEPFNDPSVIAKRTDVTSKYNTTTTKVATLHAPALCGIMAYMELEHDGDAPGAIGTQGSEICVAEYPSHTGLTHVAVFNATTGKFQAGKFSDASSSPQAYSLKEDGDSGAALFFALMPAAMGDSEFSENYYKLLTERESGFADKDNAAKIAALLCDNLYRRIENADNLGDAGIKTNISRIGNIQALTPLNLNKGAYAPSAVLHGNFQILKPGSGSTVKEPAIKHEEFAGQYKLSERPLTAAAQQMIPKLPSWYVIPREVVRVCQHAMMTTASAQPMRNFMLRGEAGTGKTEGAKGSRIPIVRLKPLGKNKVCPLLSEGRCRVHDVKPVVCAMFPVGRAIVNEHLGDADVTFCFSDVQYIINPVDCGSVKRTQTVRRWLERYNIPVNDEFFIKWSETISGLTKAVTRFENAGVTERELNIIWDGIYGALYIKYDTGQEFLPQFIANSISIREVLDKMTHLKLQGEIQL